MDMCTHFMSVLPQLLTKVRTYSVLYIYTRLSGPFILCNCLLHYLVLLVMHLSDNDNAKSSTFSWTLLFSSS